MRKVYTAFLAVLLSLLWTNSARAQSDIIVTVTISSTNPAPDCRLTFTVVVKNGVQPIPGVRISASETDTFADTDANGKAILVYENDRDALGEEIQVGVGADVYGRNYPAIFRYTPTAGGHCSNESTITITEALASTEIPRPLPTPSIPDGVGDTGGGGAGAGGNLSVSGLATGVALLLIAAYGGARRRRLYRVVSSMAHKDRS